MKKQAELQKIAKEILEGSYPTWKVDETEVKRDGDRKRGRYDFEAERSWRFLIGEVLWTIRGQRGEI